MAPFDPADAGPCLRAHADALRHLCHHYRAALRPGTIEDVTLAALSLDTDADRLDAEHDATFGAADEERQAEAVRLALLRRQDAAHGVLRLMQRPAPVLPPRPAAEVVPFRPRTKAAMPLHLTHETEPGVA